MSVVSKGLEGIVAAETRLGEVNGADGILFYCGYDINELVKVSYEEVVYLLCARTSAKPPTSSI
jgi:citrate synthase